MTDSDSETKNSDVPLEKSLIELQIRVGNIERVLEEKLGEQQQKEESLCVQEHHEFLKKLRDQELLKKLQDQESIVLEHINRLRTYREGLEVGILDGSIHCSETLFEYFRDATNRIPGLIEEYQNIRLRIRSFS